MNEKDFYSYYAVRLYKYPVIVNYKNVKWVLPDIDRVFGKAFEQYIFGWDKFGFYIAPLPIPKSHYTINITLFGIRYLVDASLGVYSNKEGVEQHG